MTATVWACVKDPGGTNGVLPVVAELRKRGVGVLVIANGKAPELKVVQELGTYFVARSSEEVLATLPLPKLLITSMCSKGGVGRDLVPFMRKRGIPTVAGQDQWGSYLATDWADPRFYPDMIWVGDEQGDAIVRRAWPTFGGDIWVTGYPALDRYAMQPSPPADDACANALPSGSGDAPLVFFAGGLAGTSATLALVVRALNKTAGKRGVDFIPRQHPRMRDDARDEVDAWNSALKEFTAGSLRGDESFSIRSLLEVADVVVGTTSTVLLEAAALRKQVISVLTPAEVERYRTATGGLMKEFPLVTLGCAEKVTNQRELERALRSALRGNLGLRAKQILRLQLDGKNAVRAADRVMALLT